MPDVNHKGEPTLAVTFDFVFLLSALAFALGSRVLAETARCEAAQLVLDNGSVPAVPSWAGPSGRLVLTNDSSGVLDARRG
jgi:hypothetical protein